MRRPSQTRRARPGHSPDSKSVPVVVLRGSRFEVCLVRGNKAIKRLGSVGVALANDARRHGEDLLARLLERARRDLERNELKRAVRLHASR